MFNSYLHSIFVWFVVIVTYSFLWISLLCETVCHVEQRGNSFVTVWHSYWYPSIANNIVFYIVLAGVQHVETSSSIDLHGIYFKQHCWLVYAACQMQMSDHLGTSLSCFCLQNGMYTICFQFHKVLHGAHWGGSWPIP